ncbi:MAG TPA: hypothetical protein VK137_00455, partial [Planctomycetaceae bacterium]|nr:hypothetical protein [Planctomycetaceae bacterium]
MVLRRTRRAAGVLAIWMFSAIAGAQPPVENPPAVTTNPAGTPPAATSYPSDNSSYILGNGESFYDGQELGPQFRFQADWVFFTRQNRAKSIPVFSGPESVNQRDIDFNFQSGYRLNLGFMNDDFELEGSFFSLNGLDGSRSGTLANAVVFDGPTGFAAATPAAQAAVGVDPNFLTSTTLFSPINAAANHNSATAADNETNELEFLDPGTQFLLKYTSSLQDFDINLKGRRQSGRLLRFGFGYRNIQFNESGLAAMRGSFNTADTDGDETAGNNDPNDGLSNAALTAVPGAGLTLASGAGGFSENTPPVSPDQLLFTSSTRATNQLNGVQGTVDATFLESEYFQLGGYAKAGVYHNAARGSVSERYQDLLNSKSTYTRSFSDSKDRAAFAGNLGLTGTVFLRENLRLFGG